MSQKRGEVVTEDLNPNDIVAGKWVVETNHINRDRYGWSGDIGLSHHASQPEEEFDWYIKAQTPDEAIDIAVLRKDPEDVDHFDVKVIHETSVKSKEEAYDAINELVAEYEPY